MSHYSSAPVKIPRIPPPAYSPLDSARKCGSCGSRTTWRRLTWWHDPNPGGWFCGCKGAGVEPIHVTGGHQCGPGCLPVKGAVA